MIQWSQFPQKDFSTSVKVSPDGQLLAVTGNDRTSRIWNTITRTTLFYNTFTGAANCSNFSPNSQWLASGDNYGNLWVYETYRWSNPGWYRYLGSGVRATGFSTDGNLVYYCDTNGYLGAYTLNSKFVFRLLVAGGYSMDRLAVSPKGDTLAVGGGGPVDGSIVYLRKATTGAGVRMLTGLAGTVTGIVYSPDGTRIYAADSKGNVRYWKVGLNDPTGTPVQSFATTIINNLSINPDGTCLSVQTNKSQVILISTADGFSWQPIDLAFEPKSAAYSTDGLLLYVVGRSPNVAVYNAATRALVDTLGTIGYNAYSLDWCPDGNHIAVSEYTRTYELGAKFGEALDMLTPGGNITATAYSPDCRWLAIGNTDDELYIKNHATGVWGYALKTAGMTDIPAIAFTPGGDRLAAGSTDNNIYLWVSDGTFVKKLVKHTGDVTALAYSPNGTLLVSGDSTGEVHVWNAATGDYAVSLTKRSAKITRLRFTSDGAYLGVSFGTTVEIYAAPTLTTVGELYKAYTTSGGVTDGTNVNDFAFSPNGVDLVMGSEKGLLHFVKVATGARVSTTDLGAIRHVAMSPTGLAVAVSGDNLLAVVSNPLECAIGLLESPTFAATGGSTIPMLVRLTSPAPTSGVFVSLSSNDPNVLVPAWLYVSAGYDTAGFYAETVPVKTPLTAIVEASGEGVQLPTPVTVLPPYVESLTVSQATVVGGNSITGTVRLAGPAPVGGMIVKLKATNAKLPIATITVAKGTWTKNFTINTVATTVAKTATITATTLAVQKVANFKVTP